ncbi:MAG: acyltransferase [Clostridia bacterium]|nr:acyltransferase [Clostridia bacterium]
MIIYVTLFAAMCLFGVKFNLKRNSHFDDYMSPEKTTAIKGIFILIVFFSHFNSYADFTLKGDLIYESVVKLIGQWMVTLFMFYSGYGVMEQIKKKGTGYIRTLPSKRIAALLFKFDIAVLIFVLIKIILNEKIRPMKLVLSFTGWESMGNSNWYIFDILLLYAVTYIAFRFIKDEKRYVLGVAGVTAFCLGYILFLAKTDIKEYWWYDTVLCYCAGMFWSLYRKYFEKLIADNRFVYALSLLLLAFASLVTKKYDENGIVNILSMLFFTAFVVAGTMRISFCNKALVWCGKYLFEIYILQRIPMKLLGEFSFMKENVHLYFALCLVITVVLAFVFSALTGKLWKGITAAFCKKRKLLNFGKNKPLIP